MVRVINSNPYDITVYADVVNFTAQGETGQARFIPILETETQGQTLAEWVSISGSEFTIKAEQTMEVPFTIKVPENAPPGGHFSAILIGTKSLSDGAEATKVETSQVVTALIFLRVTGDIVEDGQVREFRSTASLSERPEMGFELRFQNLGNVQIIPQGEIRIFNMWGQERGIIPVNRQTMFGNVLPGQIRKYSFSWSGEWSLADIGRYTAVATLAYGDEQRQFASSETSFWVLPWKIVLTVLLVLAAFIMILVWSVKLYIRKMLAIAGVTPGASLPQDNYRYRTRRKKVSVVAPIEEGILDLSQRIKESESKTAQFATLLQFVREYRIFFLVATLVIGFIIVLIMYVQSASVTERAYQVVTHGIDADVAISSEQLEYESQKGQGTDVATTSVKADFPPIKIVNRSGVSGLAAQLRLRIETLGYPVVALDTELDANERNTVIVYAPEYVTEALALSADVYGALTSAYGEASGTETPIIIYVGTDLENAVQ